MFAVFRFIVLAFLVLGNFAAATAQKIFPVRVEPFINDYAQVIAPQDKSRIHGALANLMRTKDVEFVVVTINSISDYLTSDGTIESFSKDLFNNWHIGDAQRNDGIGLVLVVKDRKVRIELGLGYGTGNSVEMDEVIKAMTPDFKQDAYGQGIFRGVTAIVERITAGKPLCSGCVLREEGDAEAQFNLGVMYQNGAGVSRDDVTATMWYRKAAEQGFAMAQFVLGVRYHLGLGVPKDDVEALKWYLKAAEQGESALQYALGDVYHQGRGVPRDDAEAVKWFRKAAEQGDALAQFTLGCMYQDGEGVPRDYVEAYMWLSLALGQGQPDARLSRLNDLEKVISPEQIADGQEMARDWKPKVK
jgi:TPR repeat protein